MRPSWLADTKLEDMTEEQRKVRQHTSPGEPNKQLSPCAQEFDEFQKKFKAIEAERGMPTSVGFPLELTFAFPTRNASKTVNHRTWQGLHRPAECVCTYLKHSFQLRGDVHETCRLFDNKIKILSQARGVVLKDVSLVLRVALTLVFISSFCRFISMN